MATFNVALQKPNKQGIYNIYILCVQNRKNQYINTGKKIHESKVKGKEIKDAVVLKQCYTLIEEYNNKLNKVDCRNWDVKKVVEYISIDNDNISFYDFCNEFVKALRNNDQVKSADNYQAAINSFRKSFGEDVNFMDITSYKLSEWIKTISHTKRAKESYPKAIKTIFEAGKLKFNDYNNNIIRIGIEPFKGVKIPIHEESENKAIDIETIRKIVNFKPYSKQTEMAVEVVTLMIYFAGINTVDIFKRVKSEIKDGKLCYIRSKTRKRTGKKPYIEITIRTEIEHLMTKWNKGERIWNYGYGNSDDFNRYVNRALLKICDKLGVEKVTTYAFRDSWATIAENYFGISEENIGYCLTHQSKNKVTAGYIDKKFNIVDEVRDKIVDLIFFSENTEEKIKLKNEVA